MLGRVVESAQFVLVYPLQSTGALDIWCDGHAGFTDVDAKFIGDVFRALKDLWYSLHSYFVVNASVRLLLRPRVS
jgi:hypothetical protein